MIKPITAVGMVLIREDQSISERISCKVIVAFNVIVVEDIQHSPVLPQRRGRHVHVWCVRP